MMVCGAASNGVHAQASTPPSSGVYTTQQAAQGEVLYQSKCTTCHNTDLSGDGMAPALAGAGFAAHWAGQPMADLFDTIHTTMPSDQPGSLTAQQAADLLAFFLSSNRYPAGPTELPAATDHLQLIVFDKVSPAPAN
jgi:cytochrome c